MTTNGVRLWCLEAGPPDGPLVLLMHGFPEIAYSWRNQIGPLGAAGFHVIAPDMPGYGRSDKPDVTYDCEWINATLMGLADALGHGARGDRRSRLGRPARVDHGAPDTRNAVAGVIGVNTPDLPRPPAPPVETLRERDRRTAPSTSCSSRIAAWPSGCSRGAAARTTTSST